LRDSFVVDCRECDEEIREAAAGIMFAAAWCGDLPELPLARTILADKFKDFAVAAKEGSGIVNPMVLIGMRIYDLTRSSFVTLESEKWVA
jgi:Ca2+/Na+ antiporter